MPGARRPFHLLAYPPQDNRNPELTALYPKNILRVIEEVRYNPADETARIDLVLFINGLANKLWDYSSDTADPIDHVRKMPAEKFVEFMMDMGLYELLRGEQVEA